MPIFIKTVPVMHANDLGHEYMLSQAPCYISHMSGVEQPPSPRPELHCRGNDQV